MAAQDYIATRTMRMKEIVRERRKEAGYSQQVIADLLGCNRSRISDIENLEKDICYTLGEIELLAGLFGINPLDLLRMSGEEAIALGQFVTEKQTAAALLDLVDCVLPPPVAKFYTQTPSSAEGQTYMPDPVLFSPSGAIIATFLDTAEAQDWEDWHNDPYRFTLLCWDTQSGALLAQICLPYVERLAVLDDTRLVIAITEPANAGQEDEDQEYRHELIVWNVRSNSIERKIELLERAENLAASTDSTYFAAFFPRTTTIQCWRTADWFPSHAFELETHRGDLDAPGGTYQVARLVEELPRERKIAPWMADYQASRFAFQDDHLLVFRYGTRLVEFDLRHQQGYAYSPFEHPFTPWAPIHHHRNEQREIAILGINHAYQFHETQVELAYLVLPTETQRYSIDTSVQLVKRVPGAVLRPIILDEETILALVEYDTDYRWHMAYKTRIGIWNVISGKVVMLSDQGRLHGGDNQISATISSKGDAVAYWICPYEGTPRLTVQRLQVSALQGQQCSLKKELEKSRKRLRAQLEARESMTPS